jgi:hypothetical protein
MFNKCLALVVYWRPAKRISRQYAGCQFLLWCCCVHCDTYVQGLGKVLIMYHALTQQLCIPCTLCRLMARQSCQVAGPCPVVTTVMQPSPVCDGSSESDTPVQ